MKDVNIIEQALRRIWSFSKALDLALIDDEVQKGLNLKIGYGHGERVGYISAKLAYILGLRGKDLFSLLTAGLMHDIGAVGSFAEYHGRPHLMAVHSQHGAEIIKVFPFGEVLAEAIRNHHKTPENQLDISLAAKIISFADKLDILLGRNALSVEDRQRLINQVNLLSGKEFYPEVVEAFNRLAKEEAFWLYLKEADLLEPTVQFLSSGMDSRDCGEFADIGLKMYGEDFTDKLADIFAFLIDQKSTYTGRHSRSVAETAAAIAEGLGWEEKQCKEIKLAGLLHDLGKLAIPKKILDKPGPLNEEETRIIHTHAFHTYNLLAAARFPRNIVEWAAYHHERPDGGGYPFGIAGDSLSMGSRLMACADIYVALTEDRPYRQALPREKAFMVMEKNIERSEDWKGLLAVCV